MRAVGEVSIQDANLANPAHARGVLEILAAYAREPGGGSREIPPDVRERLIPALRDQGHAVVLVALWEERPVGVAVCFEGFSTFAARPLMNVHDLAVLPSHRGRGIGRRLLDAVEARARELGCCKLTLEVIEDNETARGLYRSFGFDDAPPSERRARSLFLTKRLG